MNPAKGISFQDNGTAYRLKRRKSIKAVINEILVDEKKSSNFINIVLCSDEFILEMNSEYLGHHYFTDVITFNYTNLVKIEPIEGEIYISVDRVKENSQLYNVPVENEMARVIIHGVLHLCGYNDDNKLRRERMSKLEDKYLQLL